MATTARVIFRGLTAFLWDKDNKRMVAVPLSGGLCADEELAMHARNHDHLPRVEWLGHRADNRNAWKKVTKEFHGTLSFAWDPELGTNEVTRTETFEGHVPSYADLGAGGAPNPNALRHFHENVPRLFEKLTPREIRDVPSVAAVVHCDAGSKREGRLCATEMEVTDVVRFWRSPAREDGPATPKVHQPVHFAGAVADPDRSWYLASECTLRFQHPQNNAKFVITTTTDDRRPRHRSKKLASLQSWRVKQRHEFRHSNPAHPARHDLYPDDIEVLITSYSSRVSEPLPFSAHYQWVFDLHRYGPAGPSADDIKKIREGWPPKRGDLKHWGDELRRYLSDLYPDLPGVAQHPFPYIATPRLIADRPGQPDGLGSPIRDWDDRDLCPFIWGGGDD